MVAGVCEGIGARYQIDPVIVRLAFVALTLTFGGGVFVYLLLWLLMPRFGTDISPWSAVNTPRERITPLIKKERDTGWLLVIALVIFFPSLASGEGSWAASSLVTALAAAGGIYLLHRRCPVPPQGLMTPAPAAPLPGSTVWNPSTPDAANPGAGAVQVPPSASPAVDTSHLTVPEGFTHPGAGRATPPSWDPLGAAPELWHLPEPAPMEPAQPAPKPRRPLRTLAIILGIMVSLSAASFAAWAAFSHFGSVPLGDQEFAVTDDLRDSYTSGVGDTTLDLSRLTELDAPRTVEVNHGIGDLEIIPPRDVRVELTCSAGVGNTSCPAVINPDARGDVLRLDAHVGIGDIEVND